MAGITCKRPANAVVAHGPFENRGLEFVVFRMKWQEISWRSDARRAGTNLLQVSLNGKALHHIRILQIDDGGSLIPKPLRVAGQDHQLQGASRWAQLGVTFGDAAENS